MSINKNHLNLVVCLTLIATLGYFVFKNYVDNVEIIYELGMIKERLDKIKEKKEDEEDGDNDIYNDFEGIIDVSDELGDMFHHYSYDLQDNRANIQELNSDNEEQELGTEQKSEQKQKPEQETEQESEQIPEQIAEQIENIKDSEEKSQKVRRRNNKKNI